MSDKEQSQWSMYPNIINFFLDIRKVVVLQLLSSDACQDRVKTEHAY